MVEELFQKFCESPEWNKFRSNFDSLWGKCGWWFLPRLPASGECLKADIRPPCAGARGGRCRKIFLSAINEANRTRRPKRFICPQGFAGLWVPLLEDDHVKGFLGLCHINPDVSEYPIDLFLNFAGVLCGKAAREIELTHLYETIRPQTLALSTVHTVHRLINPMADLRELLAQIARLALQALHASRCVVMLPDKKQKRLIPWACVDKRNRTKSRILRNNNSRVFREVAETGNPFRKAKVLVVPLIEEEPLGAIGVWRRREEGNFTGLDEEILLTLAEQAVVAIRNAELYREQEHLARETFQSLGRILDIKAPYLPRSSRAFSEITLGVGEELGFSREELRSLRYAVEFHRAGHAAIPEKILRKPDRLNKKEYEIVKRHTRRGARLVEPLKVLRMIAPTVLYHHEHFNGSGYPAGLKKNRIPLGARILAVTEAFQAMREDRPYRRQKSVREAIEEIRRQSGRQFDPRVVAAFLRTIARPDIRRWIEKRS